MAPLSIFRRFWSGLPSIESSEGSTRRGASPSIREAVIRCSRAEGAPSVGFGGVEGGARWEGIEGRAGPRPCSGERDDFGGALEGEDGGYGLTCRGVMELGLGVCFIGDGVEGRAIWAARLGPVVAVPGV